MKKWLTIFGAFSVLLFGCEEATEVTEVVDEVAVVDSDADGSTQKEIDAEQEATEQEEIERRRQQFKDREQAQEEQEAKEKELAQANPNKSGRSVAPKQSIEVVEDQVDVEVNDNVPFFSNEDITSTDTYHQNGPLDDLGRVTAANGLLGVEIMPASERGNPTFEPTGWSQARYANIGAGGWLYNRSHLIGFQFTGNDDYANLMTGTRAFNMQMLEYENFVANYIETTENHVRYRVTPVFEGDNLVASGAYMEAFSIEDNGAGVMFNVYVPNVQEGVEIDYADGSSVGPAGPAEEGEITPYTPSAGSNSSGGNESSSAETPTPAPTPEPTPEPTPPPAPAPAVGEYVDENGNGLIKGSSSGIYHTPGSTYYSRTTNPVAMFKSIAEAEAAGYRAPKR